MTTAINNISNNNNCQVQAAKITGMEENKKLEGKGSVSSYYEKLCSKYPKLKITVDDYECCPKGPYIPGQYSNGSESVWGNVHLNYQYLQKASKDPQAAAHLEGFLSGIPMAQKWLSDKMTAENTEITEFGFGIGPDGETNSYMSLRMPAKNSNISADRQSVIDEIQERNKAEVERRERLEKKESRKQPLKKQNVYEVWESIQDKAFLEWEQGRAELREERKEESVKKMLQRNEAYEQKFQKTVNFDLQR